MSANPFDSPEARRVHEEMWRQMAEADLRKQSTTLTGTNCFVCYLDLDGFKDRVSTTPHDLFEQYQKQREFMLASFFRAGAQASGSNIKLDHYDKMLWPYLFSDSWFFSTIDSSDQALLQISSVASGIFMRCWEIGFPAHGGIAEGPLWWRPDLQIMLGPGLAKAYLTAESMDCFGVAAHPDLLARGSARAFTAPQSILQKRRHFGVVPVHKKISFCRLYAYKSAVVWNTENYLKRYDDMASAYAATPGCKARVVARYMRSRTIIRAMLANDAQQGAPGNDPGPPGSARA